MWVLREGDEASLVSPVVSVPERQVEGPVFIPTAAAVVNHPTLLAHSSARFYSTPFCTVRDLPSYDL